MTGLYLRWGAILAVAVILAVLASRYYDRNLASVAPDDILAGSTDRVVRVTGMVRAGTLKKEATSTRIRFDLAGMRETLAVQYDGPPQENLRELKTLVVIGRWDPTARLFQAHDIALVANYGFVVGAYVIGLVPLALFLFTMERKVDLLYHEIKQSKLYEPQAVGDADPR